MKFTTRILGALAVVLSTTALAAAQDTPPVAAPAGGIVVYNAQHAALTQAWVDAFTAATGIPVVIRQGSDLELANQIVQEGAASPADVFLTENSPAMGLVDAAGLFAPVDQATLDQVPADFRPSHGNWTGIAARTTVFAYNPSLLTEAQLPASLLDLASPEWQGRWGAAPAGADFQAIVSALLALKGDAVTADWLAGLQRNAVVYRGNGAAMRGVNAGEVPGAVIYHYYYFGDKAGTGENTTNVALHYFGHQDPGAFVSVSGGGVLASSDHADLAQRFLAFVTGPEGQAILRDGTSFEYAVGAGVASNPALVPLADLGYPAVDPALLNGARVVELMTAAGII